MPDNKPLHKSLKITVKPELDENSMSNINKEIDAIGSNFKKILAGDDADNLISKIKEASKEQLKDVRTYETLLSRKKDLEGLISSRTTSKEDRKEFREALKKVTEEIKNTEAYRKQKEDERKEDTKETLKKIGDSIKEKVVDYFTDILKNVKKFLDDMASFNVSGSIYGTGEARQKMLQYGTSEAETYALSKTMSLLNLNSEEDLWYMNANQRQTFADLIGRYTSKYQELANKDFFKSYEEFKLEWQLLKEELTYELIDVIMNNKDTIIEFVKLGVDAMKGLINFFGHFGNSNKAYSVADIMNNYQSTNNSLTNSYQFTNTYNVNDTSVQSAQMFASNMINVIKQLTNS